MAVDVEALKESEVSGKCQFVCKPLKSLISSSIKSKSESVDILAI